MLILGLDLETTGLDVRTNEIIEVGAVVWDVESKKPQKMYSDFVKIESELPAEITQITGIEKKDIDLWGKNPEEVLREIKLISKGCSHVVAHNGLKFDKLILERYWKKHPEFSLNMPWIDTTQDLPYPSTIITRKLNYLASEHGFLNPFSHRAVFDVLTMLAIFSKYDFIEIQSLQTSPLQKIAAQVSYDDREKAKALGFYWDPNNKQWVLEAKKCRLEQMNFPFPVIQI